MSQPLARPVAPTAVDALAGSHPVPGCPNVRQTGDLLLVPVGSSIAEAERALILATLDRHQWHRRRSAASLGLSLKTLYNRLQAYGHADRAEGPDGAALPPRAAE